MRPRTERARAGPLDNLPRPLDERDGRRRRRRVRRAAGAIIGTIVLAAGGAAVLSLAHGPIGPIGDVQGVIGTPPAVAAAAATAPPSMAVPTLPSPVATRAPTPPPPPTPLPPSSLVGYRSPLPHGRLTLPFGPSPWGSRLVAGKAFHDGIDLATFCGDRVVAAHAGTVLAAGRRYDRFMGWIGDLGTYVDRLDKKGLWSSLPVVVVIDDGNGYRSIYAHFGRVVVAKGDVVRAGQLLGYEGMTGRASGCHVHYGLFSPLETATFGIDPAVVRRMRVPDRQIARIDPLLVLPQHAPRGSAAPAGALGPARPADDSIRAQRLR
jgi:murein DD-endopeptidase MepM/ murein hydrolase activator NlpD